MMIVLRIYSARLELIARNRKPEAIFLQYPGRRQAAQTVVDYFQPDSLRAGLPSARRVNAARSLL
jgi:hypothetical protein